MISQHDAALTAFAAWAQIHDKAAFEMFTALGCPGQRRIADRPQADRNASPARAAAPQRARYRMTDKDRQTILRVTESNPGPHSIAQLRQLTGIKQLSGPNLAGLTRNGYLAQEGKSPDATWTFKASRNSNVQPIQSSAKRGRRGKGAAQAATGGTEQQPIAATG